MSFTRCSSAGTGHRAQERGKVSSHSPVPTSSRKCLFKITDYGCCTLGTSKKILNAPFQNSQTPGSNNPQKTLSVFNRNDSERSVSFYQDKVGAATTLLFAEYHLTKGSKSHHCLRTRLRVDTLYTVRAPCPRHSFFQILFERRIIWKSVQIAVHSLFASFAI